MIKVHDYNESVMGSIDFQIDFDKDKTYRKTIVQLITDVIDSLNVKHREFNGENVAIHFHLDNIEDQVWFELNGLIQEAHNRRNKEMPPLQVIHNYLDKDELERFSTLSKLISKGVTSE